MPEAPKIIRPPAAANESVHPIDGYLCDPPIILGLIITVLKLPEFYWTYFSDKFFV